MGEALLAFTVFYLVIIGATLVVGFLKTRPTKAKRIDSSDSESPTSIKEATVKPDFIIDSSLPSVIFWNNIKRVTVQMPLGMFEFIMGSVDDKSAVDTYTNMALKYHLKEPIDFDTESAILEVIEE